VSVGVALCVLGAGVLSSQEASAEGGGVFGLFALGIGWLLAWFGWRLVSRRSAVFRSNVVLSLGLIRARTGSRLDARRKGPPDSPSDEPAE
jgi:hypothetical protein